MNIPYLFSIEFFIYFLYFVVAIFLSFYIPGNLLIRKFKLPFLENITICIITGMILLILQGLIFGYLGIRWASYIYIFLSLIAWIYLIKKNQLKIPKIKIDFSPLLIILFGIFGQLSAIWLMGSRFTNGVRILGGHPPDNNVNLSIINELIHRFPPFEPGMYGVPLQNYHYLSHLLNAEFIRIFNLPLITTNYQYMTIVLSLLLGLIAISLANMLNLGKKFKIWFLFLLYFGADLSFAIIFLLGKGINFDMKAMESGPDFLFNMPRAFAIVIFFGALYLLMLFLKKRSIILAFIIGIALGLLIGIKIYVGFFALVGIITFSIYETYRKRYKALIILAVSIITALIVYLPVNSNAGGLFFTGFWRISDFMVHPSLGLSSFEMARQIYQQHNNPKVYIFEILFLLLYLINTFGLRFLAFVQTKKSLSKLPVELNIFLIPAILISMVFGLFFMQKTGGANTFNFLTTALIISSLYAALSISFIQSKIKKISISIVFVSIILLLTLPRYLDTVYSNLTQMNSPYELIDNEQLMVFDYLSKNTNTNSVILASRDIGTDNQGPYINYFSQRATFLSGEKNGLQEHGINYKEREIATKNIFLDTKIENVKQTLYKNNIDYLILRNENYLKFKKDKKDLFEISFANKNFTVLKVIK